MEFPPPWQENPHWEAAVVPGGCKGALAPWGSGDMVGPGSWGWPEPSSGSTPWENVLKYVDPLLLYGGEQGDGLSGLAIAGPGGLWSVLT